MNSRSVFASSPVGKRVGTSLYVHRSAEDLLPIALQIRIGDALTLAGEIEYDLVKFSLDGDSVSFLSYPDFDDDPHPALARSVNVNLDTGRTTVRRYDESPSPPILHRKETFVAPDYPLYEQFRAETEEEERLGLLDHPPGFRRQWEAFVKAKLGG